MRYLLAALFAMLLLPGCTAMDREDRSFFYGGWMHPDQAADKRLETRQGGQEARPY